MTAARLLCPGFGGERQHSVIPAPSEGTGRAAPRPRPVSTGAARRRLRAPLPFLLLLPPPPAPDRDGGHRGAGGPALHLLPLPAAFPPLLPAGEWRRRPARRAPAPRGPSAPACAILEQRRCHLMAPPARPLRPQHPRDPSARPEVGLGAGSAGGPTARGVPALGCRGSPGMSSGAVSVTPAAVWVPLSIWALLWCELFTSGAPCWPHLSSPSPSPTDV